MTDIVVSLSSPPLSVDIVGDDAIFVINQAEPRIRDWVREGRGLGIQVACRNKEIENRVRNTLDALVKDVIDGSQGERHKAAIRAFMQSEAVRQNPMLGNRHERRAAKAKNRARAELT